MPGVTEQEIAQAKQMNLYQYMQLCEPDNFKPEGPGQFRHKGHSSLTFAEDGSWTYFKTKATGRTALNYLIAVEGVSFVEAVREINRIQGGVRPSFQPVKAPSPPAEKKPAKEFRLPKPDKNNYAATAYLRKRCIHPNVLTVCKQKRILYQLIATFSFGLHFFLLILFSGLIVISMSLKVSWICSKLTIDFPFMGSNSMYCPNTVFDPMTAKWLPLYTTAGRFESSIFFCLLYLYAVHLKPNCCVACFNCVRFTPSLPMCTTCPTSTISTSNP